MIYEEKLANIERKLTTVTEEWLLTQLKERDKEVEAKIGINGMIAESNRNLRSKLSIAVSQLEFIVDTTEGQDLGGLRTTTQDALKEIGEVGT